MAFSGLVLDGNTIGDGSSADDPLLPSEIGPDGSFQFTFTATPGQFVFIDPLVATGYDYAVGAGSPSILTALFPSLGDLDGYELYLLGDLSNPIATGIMGGSMFDLTTLFPGGVSGFSLRGINPALSLAPGNTAAFVTGLTFDVSANQTVFVSQTPVTTLVAAVPEPATWAMLLIGFGVVGAMTRIRRRAARVAFAA